MRTSRLFFYLPLFLFLLAGCGGESGPTPEEILTGSWKLHKFDMQNNPDPMPIQIMATSSFNFAADGTYEILMGQLERGTWKLSEDKKVLITIPQGTQQEQHIDLAKVTPEEVVLTNNAGAQPVTMTLRPVAGATEQPGHEGHNH